MVCAIPASHSIGVEVLDKIGGTPILVYHILSHYIDALILLISGLEPWDSYGLFFHFKIVLFLSSILFFIGFILKKVNVLI